MTGKAVFPAFFGSGVSVTGYVIREKAAEVKKNSGPRNLTAKNAKSAKARRGIQRSLELDQKLEALIKGDAPRSLP
jgi:hypothetical protein